MNQSKKLTDGAMLTAIFIVLMLVSIFIPGISLIAFFLLPIPFIVYTYRYDWTTSLLMLLAASLLSTLFFSIVAIPMALLAGLGGIMLGASMRHDVSPYETLARGAVGFIAGIVLMFLFSEFILDVNFASELDKVLDESLETSQQVVQSVGVEQSAEEIEAVESLVYGLKDLIPVGIAIIATVLSLIAQWLSYKLLNRIERTSFKFPPFRELRFPVVMVWIYLIVMILMLFDIDPNSTLYLGIQNVYMLVGLLIALQGFSLFFYYQYQKGRSKALPVIGVIATLIFPFMLLYIVRIVGIIDIGFNLRDRIEKVEK